MAILDGEDAQTETGSEDSADARLYVAFEGGGAKGIVHVGALRAIEARGFRVCGVAGTSAGAIVAALKAVGYTGSEMVDVVTGKTILDRFSGTDGPLRSVDLFGPGGWAAVSRFKRVIGRMKRLRWWEALGAALVLLVTLPSIAALHPSLAVAVVLLLISAAIVAVVILAWLLAGLSRLDYFAERLDEVLAARFFSEPPGRPLTFGDIRDRDRDRQGVCLKIVATDLSGGTLRLFSSESADDRQVCVAHAVAASICLPVVFAPWRIGTQLFLDGGLVSNLPVWPFDERRALDPDARTVAVEIDDPAGFESDAALPMLWLPRLLRTAIFGAGILNKRAVADLCMIRLKTTLGLLEFDSPRHRYTDEVIRAEAAADNQIARQIVAVPALFRKASSELHPVMVQLLKVSSLFEDDDGANRLRIAIAKADSGYTRSLRLQHGFGYEDDMDEGLTIDQENSPAGTAWSTGDTLLLWSSPDERSLAEALFPGPENRWNRKKLRKDVNWMLTVPVFQMNNGDSNTGENQVRPSFVVQVVGTSRLDGDESEIDAFIDLAIELIENIYMPVANDPRAIENG